MLIAGLPGDAGHSQNVGWIDVTSYSQSAGVRPCLKAVVTKALDRATPGPATFAVSGQKIPLATIEIWSGGVADHLVFRAKLEQVTVDQVEILDEPGSAFSVLESIVLLPRRVTTEYITQAPTGLPGPIITGTLAC